MKKNYRDETGRRQWGRAGYQRDMENDAIDTYRPLFDVGSQIERVPANYLTKDGD